MKRFPPTCLVIVLLLGIPALAADQAVASPDSSAVGPGAGQTPAGSPLPAPTARVAPVAGAFDSGCPGPEAWLAAGASSRRVDGPECAASLPEPAVCGAGAGVPAAAREGEWYYAGGEIASSPKPIALLGDSRPGIVFGNSLGRIYVLTADGAVAPGWPVVTGTLVGYGSAAVADLDGDGAEDVVYHANNTLEAYSQGGTPLAGWPRTLDGGFSGNAVSGSPTVADIDGDGDLEVMVGHYRNLYAFHHDGNLVTGWPVTQPVYFGPSFSTPAAGDLDGDGDLEICFKIYGGNGLPADIRLYHHNGAVVTGWPKLGLDRSHISSPVLADIDGDGQLDVVVSLHYYSGANYVRLYVWKADGSDVAGFPVSGAWNTAPVNNAVGDADDDGHPEIFVSTSNATPPYYAVHAWNHNGTTLAGTWPRGASLCLSDGSPVLADLNAGRNEVLAGVGGCYTSDPGALHAWTDAGLPLLGWPKTVAQYMRSSPLVIDGDADGVPELYVGSSGGWIHRFLGVGSPGSSLPEWNQIFHDPRNTNCYADPENQPADTVSVGLGCQPPAGTLPFTVAISVALENLVGHPRVVAGRLALTLAGGTSFPSYRSGYATLDPLETFQTNWNQSLPAYSSLVGNNVFRLLGSDVTPSPFNQPPYPPSGDTDTEACTVTGQAP